MSFRNIKNFHSEIDLDEEDSIKEKTEIDLDEEDSIKEKTEPVKVEGDAFSEAKGKEKIDYSQDRLTNLEITEPVEVEGAAFFEAKGIKVKTVKTKASAFHHAENCQVKTVEAKFAFSNAKNCQVEEVKAGGEAFYKAKNCQAEKVETGDNAFFNAKNCQVDIIEAESIGEKSRGVVVLKEARGDVFPPVILMKGKVKENSEEVKEFFQKELKKSQQGEESIFDYLSFFEWEGETLEQGNKILKERYERIKNKKLLEELREYNFYYLIDDNFKREEILSGLEKLRIVERTILEDLNSYLSKLEKIKQDLSVLSLKDWIKIGEYRDFLDYDEEELKNIKNKFKDITLETILENPEEFKKLEIEARIAKQIIKLRKEGKEIDRQELEKELQKKIKNIIKYLSNNPNYDEKELKKIKNKFKDIDLETILENPQEFEKPEMGAKIAKWIIELRNRGEIIRDKQKLKKELQKKIENKTNHLIREYLLNKPKKNVEDYLRKLRIEREIDQDIVFAANLYKRMERKGSEKNKEILEQLMKGRKPLDWSENKEWLLKMKNKIDIEAWLRPCSKEYSPLTSINYQDSLIKSQKKQKQEIIEHLGEVGIEVSLETEIQEIKEILEKRKQEIPENLQKDIKTHLDAISSLKGVEKSRLPQKIILEVEKNPLKILQMGQKVIGSCLRLEGGSEKSAIVNSIDINKQVVWAKDEKERILGRVLIGITEKEKLAGFRLYNNDPRIELESCFRDFLSSLVKELKTELTSEGEIKELIGEKWYNDGIVNWEKQESL